MKRMTATLILLSVACVYLLQKPDPSQARFISASNIVFEARIALKPDQHSFLAYVDLQNKDASPFFADPNWNIRPLDWSPNGDLLAVAFYSSDLTPSTQICILTRQAQLQTCLEDAPSYFLISFSSSEGEDYLYHVSWSSDEKKVYFVSGNGYIYRLVEGDTHSGKTLRILYSGHDSIEDFTSYSWTKTLDYLIVGAGDRARVLHSGTASLLRLSASSSSVPLSNIELVKNVSVQGDNSSGSALRIRRLAPCPFSPKTNSIPFYEITSFGLKVSQFTLSDKTGSRTQNVLQQTAAVHVPQNCPSWQADEKAFYFSYSVFDDITGQPISTIIDKYTFGTGQTTDYFNGTNLPALSSPLVVSPDTNYLAYDTFFNPGYVPATGEPPYAPRIAVIGPNNTVSFYGKPYTFANDPV